MTYKIENKKWILYRHTRNFELICAVAVNLKYFSKASISKKDKLGLLKKLKELSFYKERNPELPLDSINHRINTLAYYMFGYKDIVNGESRFLFSPLGNLFLKHLGNKINVSKIFLTMLWAIQFEHPHGGTDSSFKLYPFRLIFELLNDERLENKLYAFEVAYIIVFVKSIDKDTYEKLVIQLLSLRQLPNKQLQKLFQSNVHLYVNSVYEWDYYVTEFLQSAGVFDKTIGETITKLRHGNTKTYRKVTKNYVKLNAELITYCKKLRQQYPFSDLPLPLNESGRLKIDVIKEIYGFYPKIILEEVEEILDIQVSLLELPKLIDKYANNEAGETAFLFEDILTDGFNMFYNVKAKKIGGASNTDVECLFITRKIKFAVDAKSTKNKLLGLNSGRLTTHREKIGGEYTIVVTPSYVPAVKSDIKNSKIVILRAGTFSEYLYNCINNNLRKIDYSDFDRIIIKNLGTDISPSISKLTFEKFAVNSLFDDNTKIS